MIQVTILQKSNRSGLSQVSKRKDIERFDSKSIQLANNRVLCLTPPYRWFNLDDFAILNIKGNGYSFKQWNLSTFATNGLRHKIVWFFNNLKMHRNIREGSELNVRHNLGLKYLGLITAIEKKYANSILLGCFCSRIWSRFFQSTSKGKLHYFQFSFNVTVYLTPMIIIILYWGPEEFMDL